MEFLIVPIVNPDGYYVGYQTFCVISHLSYDTHYSTLGLSIVYGGRIELWIPIHNAGESIWIGTLIQDGEKYVFYS